MDRSLIRPLITAALAENPDLAVLRDPGSWSILRDNAALLRRSGNRFHRAPLRYFRSPRLVRPNADEELDSPRDFTSDLENAGTVLGDAGIPYIPMKGPLLLVESTSQRSSENPSCRS